MPLFKCPHCNLVRKQEFKFAFYFFSLLSAKFLWFAVFAQIYINVLPLGMVESVSMNAKLEASLRMLLKVISQLKRGVESRSGVKPAASG